MSMLFELTKSAKALKVYNALCNRCKMKILHTMKKDVERDTDKLEEQSQRADMGKYYAQKTQKLLCPLCARRYKEFLENKEE